MIIDFHTHVFPDKIAEKTISLLSEKASIPPFSDGTVNGLLERMKEAGVSLSVTLPVLTNPDRFDSVNRFAAELNAAYGGNGKGLVSFAGIHPLCEDIEGKMRFIKEKGFIGVKIHPDYQQTLIDDEGYVRIVRCAMEYGLTVVTHAGVDGAFPDKIHCTPDGVLRLLERAPHPRLVLAHMGGNELTEEVIDKLLGKELYIDTAYVLRHTPKQTFLRVLEKHGAHRILFATDSPWSDMRGDVEILRSFGLDRQTEEMILYKNARALLGI